MARLYTVVLTARAFVAGANAYRTEPPLPEHRMTTKTLVKPAAGSTDVAEEEEPCLGDPLEAARAAGLTYVSDLKPGIRRVRSGRGFRYMRPDGASESDPAELARIRALVIPPGWHDVWICPSKRGHIQATGRDDRQRKQYRYHPRWQEVRDQNKYGRLVDFGKALPGIRKRVAEHLILRGLPREKVLATVVALLEATCIRIGNEEYARNNESFGLTTLRDEHAEVAGSRMRFSFRGKRGVSHEISMSDKKLASIVRKCQELPGQELFQYITDEGDQRAVNSTDVNSYLREISGEDFTAKDFRTWAGTVLMTSYLAGEPNPSSETEGKRTVSQAVKQVASHLGNTATVCRKCYIHPDIIAGYLDGTLAESVGSLPTLDGDTLSRRLLAFEPKVLRFLESRD